MVEHWIVVPAVGGSSPLAHPITFSHAPVAQWIEHQPPELRAGGSNPLRRAIPGEVPKGWGGFQKS